MLRPWPPRYGGGLFCSGWFNKAKVLLWGWELEQSGQLDQYCLDAQERANRGGGAGAEAGPVVGPSARTGERGGVPTKRERPARTRIKSVDANELPLKTTSGRAAPRKS